MRAQTLSHSLTSVLLRAYVLVKSQGAVGLVDALSCDQLLCCVTSLALFSVCPPQTLTTHCPTVFGTLTAPWPTKCDMNNIS